MASQLKDFVLEIFEPLGGVSARKMFGEYGFFKSGLMFALIYQDEIYLKADENNNAPFVSEGCKQFTYHGNSKVTKMGYWSVPERLLDDLDEFSDWAAKAFEIAVKMDAAKAPSQRKFKGL